MDLCKWTFDPLWKTFDERKIRMIKMNTMNLNAHLDRILANVIGKTIKDVTAIKLDPTSEFRWSHYDHSEFSGIRVWFTKNINIVW